jgi:hypothetical protein
MAALAGQVDDGLRQGVFVIAHNELAALCRSRLPQDPAGTALRDSELLLHMANRSSATFGAQYFPFRASSS